MPMNGPLPPIRRTTAGRRTAAWRFRSLRTRRFGKKTRKQHNSSNKVHKPPPTASDGRGALRPFDDFPHAVVFRDSQGRIGYVNRAAERLLGLEPYQIIGKSLADVLGEKTAHTRIKR